MSVNSTLEEVKELISKKYLGKAGIHGVGLRRSKLAVTVYVDPGDRPDLGEALRSIENEIKPFNLLVVQEEQPSIK
jgi:hypothetical protein